MFTYKIKSIKWIGEEEKIFDITKEDAMEAFSLQSDYFKMYSKRYEEYINENRNKIGSLGQNAFLIVYDEHKQISEYKLIQQVGDDIVWKYLYLDKNEIQKIYL